MEQRPKPLQTSKSFTRLESTSAKDPLSRSRASTLQGPPVPEILFPQNVSYSPEAEKSEGDVFTTKEAETDEEEVDERQVPDTFEELPIEIRSLTERFLESLSTKAHPQPLSIDDVADLFQDFYTRASSHINTHIATLSSRLSRAESRSPENKKRAMSKKGTDSASGEQQMLSASEMADRKKARRLLELKRPALEEAVERAVCEKVYDRIWRHRSTDDEERDQKLRSRTAALSLIGISLRELLMTAEKLTDEERAKTHEREAEIREFLSAARNDIEKMNEEQYPLGKILHLTAAHKSIVEALSKIFPASSSADEILPTLIYTLITSTPETLNVITNLHFIQRFRGSTRMDGETAYCLVNFEAAISFLETVDLSSLRADEPLTGPEKPSSRPTTPKTEITPMKLGLADAPALPQPSSALPVKNAPPTSQRPPSPTTKAQRRLSNLIQAQTNRIEAASDAVRDSILDSADQALDTLNNTLENSFKFFFGRIKEQHPNSPKLGNDPQLPKTLEDARRLVSSPTLRSTGDEESASNASSILGDEMDERQKDGSSKVADLFGGRRPLRDHSVDSQKSSNSGKRVSFNPASTGSSPLETKNAPTATTKEGGNAAVESMRNLTSTLNPLNRFANINMIPRFGRTNSPSVTTPPPQQTSSPELNKTASSVPTPPSTTRSSSAADVTSNKDSKDGRAIAALDALKKTAPPVKKFLETKDAKDLKIGDVDELLKEYQRLAGALRGAINYH